MKSKKNNSLFLYLLICVFSILISPLNASAESIEERVTEADDEEIERLFSLPYLDVSPEKIVETKSGVLKHDPSRTYPGHNLYFRMQSNEAYLMDMHGEIDHTWVFPVAKKQMWRTVELLQDGSLLVADLYNGLKKFDWDSKLIYERLDITPHHDIEVLTDGTLLLLTREFHKYRGRNVAFDTVIHMDKDGGILKRWSMFENIEQLQKLHKPSILDRGKSIKKKHIDKYRKFLKRMFDMQKVTFLDYYHANTIESLPDTPLGKKDRRFRKGNWLVSLRNVDLIAVIDKDSGEITWSWGPDEIVVPHNPSMLANGNILLFDNQGNGGYSRVIELEPISKKIVWQYGGTPPEKFFSMWRGAAQRLPNGNTLISDSVIGRAFEVTEKGDIVWEWLNPDIDKTQKLRMSVYRMRRVQAERLLMKNTYK